MATSGQGSISSSPKARAIPAPGPPFDPTSADNGLSVDPITGKIVLGNDFGGTSAALLSGREIPFDGNGITFSDIFSLTNLSLSPGSFNAQSQVFSHFAQLSANVGGAL